MADLILRVLVGLPLAGFAGGFGGTGPAAGAQLEEDPLPPSIVALVPRASDARDQLGYARRLKLLSYRAGENRRRAMRQRAVEAYQAVRTHFPEDPEAGAEAAFRAAELLRADGLLERALEEFGVARALDSGPVFRARAGLESGHIHRRQGRFGRALQQYREVVRDRRSAGRYQDDARLWIGRIHRDGRRFRAARSIWQVVATAGEDPLDRIQAYDELALLALLLDDPDEARRVLKECESSFTELILEETLLGERVRNGVLRMRARDHLTIGSGTEEDSS